MNEMTYTEWLEKEINIYKRENNLLNDKLENLTTMFNEVHDNEIETKDKKNEILKWAYSLEKENKTFLKQMDRQTEKIKQLKHNNHNSYKELYKQKIESNNILYKDNEQLEEKLNYADFVKASLFNDIEEYKKQITKLVSENTRLQNDLFTEQLNEDEADDYIESLKNELFNAHLLQQQQKQENEQLKDEIINLKTEIVDHRIKAYRLTKILNETSDYT